MLKNFMKRIIVFAILILNVFVADALSQTRKKPASSSRARRTTAARTANAKPKTATTPNIVAQAATTTASGLTYIITQKNEAGQQLKAGDTVIVHYTGLLTNGVKFDSSLDRNEPFSFPLGANRVIKGWDEGIQKLRVGERATLIIPPTLGYGSRGAGGVIPPDATLIFIVEVVGVR